MSLAATALAEMGIFCNFLSRRSSDPTVLSWGVNGGAVGEVQKCLDGLPHCPAPPKDLRGAVGIMQEDTISPEHWTNFLLSTGLIFSSGCLHEPGIQINGGILLVLTGQ